MNELKKADGYKGNTPSLYPSRNNKVENIRDFKFKIMSWNVHSLKKRYIDIKHYIVQENPAIVCLQEALHNHDSLTISGFTKYQHKTSHGLVTS